MEIHGNTIITVALLDSFGRRYYDVPHGTRIYAWGTKRFRNRFFGREEGGGGWTEQQRVRIGSSRSDSCCVYYMWWPDVFFYENGLWLPMAWSWSIPFMLLASLHAWLFGPHLLESFLKCTKANIEFTKVIQDHQGGSGWLFQGWRTSHSSTIVDPDNFAMMFFVWRKTCAQSDASKHSIPWYFSGKDCPEEISWKAHLGWSESTAGIVSKWRIMKNFSNWGHCQAVFHYPSPFEDCLPPCKDCQT